MHEHILVVDDQRDVRELVRATLEPEGHRVTLAADGQEGLRKLFMAAPDLVLVDVLMPSMDGFTLLQRIREVAEIPVIMLTVLGQESDKVRALRAGADDYIVKPFGPLELLARVDATLRRVPTKPGIEDLYSDQLLHIDLARHQVHLEGCELNLSALEFRLLVTLVQHRGIVLSADRLLDLCWGNRDSGPQAVRVYIGYLRKKLGEGPGRPRLIETVREFGYRYRALVS